MAHVAPLPPACRIAPETAADAPAIEALVLAAFGPGRFAKTAERLREGIEARPVGFVVRETDGDLVGSVRLWPVTVGTTPALFLGPIAVNTASRRAGLGADLVRACLDHADAAGAPGVLLVGDPEYFARFGFGPAPGATLPGPVDPRRVMWRGLGCAVAPEGPVRPG